MASSEALIGPTRGTQVQTVQTMRETCRFAKENVLDQKIDTYFNFGYMNLETTAGPAMFSGVGGGVPVLSDVGASLILSLLMVTTDDFAAAWDIPDTCDILQPVSFRLLWSDDAAPNAANTANFIHLYTVERAGTDAEAVGATAFTVDAGAEAAPADSATANVPGWTAWNTIGAGVLNTAGCVPADDRLNLFIELTLVTLADASVYKGQVRYDRRYV
jgi:hypothetical protein